MAYKSVSGAVVAALAAGERGDAKGQAWQKLYSATADEVGCLSSVGGSKCLDRSNVDYWMAARLHNTLSDLHWCALVARFSTNRVMKVQAVTRLRTHVASIAPQLFIYKAVTAWAIPKVKGTRLKAPGSVSVEVPLDVPAWRRDSMVNAAISAGHSMKRRLEQCSESIILPDSFYDMNTWDLNAVPESTRRRWRAGINEKLDGFVADALLLAEELLRHEGLLEDNGF